MDMGRLMGKQVILIAPADVLLVVDLLVLERRKQAADATR